MSKGRAGFTLLETLVAVFLIGMVTTALLSRFGGGFAFDLRNGAKAVVQELRATSQLAITSGRVHRFVIDFDTQTFRVEQLVEQQPESVADGSPTTAELLDFTPPRPTLEYQPAEGRLGGWRTLDDNDVFIDEMIRGDDEIDSGEASVAFGPDGAAEPALLRMLDSDGYRMDLRVVGFTGEVRVIEDPES